MRTNLVIGNPHYIIKEEEGIIVCTISAVVKHMAGSHAVINMKKCPIKSSDLSFTVKAVAKCHNEDNFSVTKGKRIAESRCKAKLFNKAYKFYFYLYEKYMLKAAESLRYFTNNKTLWMKESDHINELCK